ncbi:MAG: FliI/YscN family ATPase [Phycisphaerae bacterium]|nr:FliI/YscN family ATPase [Phycisphaerae bacterium]
MNALSPYLESVRRLRTIRVEGRVVALRGMALHVEDLPAPVGSLVRVGSAHLGEVVGFEGSRAIVMMLVQTGGVQTGDAVCALQVTQTVGVGARLLGRVLDGLGRPIDGRGPIREAVPRLIDPEPISALRRRRITEPLPTGVRVIDLMTTLGRGQRMGVFAGPGVGKSTLLGRAARRTRADVNVIGLIGERGREVRDFIDGVLGREGLERSVVVVATGDESPLMRIRAAHVACAAAEQFRDDGLDVLLTMDSVTRFAHAQRQVGLSVGEPPATKGYTPSVFAAMARLLERAGAVEPESGGARGGSITGLYTILVEGDEMNEPISDAARGILDGHIVLSRALARKGHYPAVDVLDSISRVADDVCDGAHVAARRQFTRLLSAYRQVEELVQIGAYAKGSSPEADAAIAFKSRLDEILRQDATDDESFDAARARMIRLAVEAGAALQSGPRRT